MFPPPIRYWSPYKCRRKLSSPALVFTQLDLMAAEQESDRFKPPVDHRWKTPFGNVCDKSGLKITQINDKTTVWSRYDATCLLKEIKTLRNVIVYLCISCINNSFSCELHRGELIILVLSAVVVNTSDGQ